MIDRNDLVKTLSENIPDISSKNIWIWGAGDTAQLYQEGFRRLSKEGFCIEGYIDNALFKIRKTFNDKPVISPEELNGLENICILVCSIQENVVKEIGIQLKELQAEWYLVDEIILKRHCAEVMQCYDSLYDEQSKDIYANLVMWRITGKKPELKADIGNDYFALPSFMQRNPDEVFVDCGAWRGDIVKRYTELRQGIFKKVIAFEPDKINFTALEDLAELLKEKWNCEDEAFQLYPYGVGEKMTEGRFERYEANNGQGSKFTASTATDGEICKVVSIDEYLTEPYSFLKADIESYEYQMLIGAAKSIKNNRPLLAICIYHNAVDLYTIPLLVRDIVPEYKVAIRHHGGDLTGTVLYGWI